MNIFKAIVCMFAQDPFDLAKKSVEGINAYISGEDRSQSRLEENIRIAEYSVETLGDIYKSHAVSLPIDTKLCGEIALIISAINNALERLKLYQRVEKIQEIQADIQRTLESLPLDDQHHWRDTKLQAYAKRARIAEAMSK